MGRRHTLASRMLRFTTTSSAGTASNSLLNVWRMCEYPQERVPGRGRKVGWVGLGILLCGLGPDIHLETHPAAMAALCCLPKGWLQWELGQLNPPLACKISAHFIQPASSAEDLFSGPRMEISAAGSDTAQASVCIIYVCFLGYTRSIPGSRESLLGASGTI